MISTHAVKLYIGLQEGLHNIKLCLSSLLFREIETIFHSWISTVNYCEQAIFFWNRLISNTVFNTGTISHIF